MGGKKLASNDMVSLGSNVAQKDLFLEQAEGYVKALRKSALAVMSLRQVFEDGAAYC